MRYLSTLNNIYAKIFVCVMGFVDIILCKFSSNIKGEYLAYFHAQMFCF